MTNKKMTHIGDLIGDARAPGRHQVLLRETKHFWVTKNGSKYRKGGFGSRAGNITWPLYHLDLNSIRPIDEHSS